jgi:hypothetical protein
VLIPAPCNSRVEVLPEGIFSLVVLTCLVADFLNILVPVECIVQLENELGGIGGGNALHGSRLLLFLQHEAPQAIQGIQSGLLMRRIELLMIHALLR